MLIIEGTFVVVVSDCFAVVVVDLTDGMFSTGIVRRIIANSVGTMLEVVAVIRAVVVED